MSKCKLVIAEYHTAFGLSRGDLYQQPAAFLDYLKTGQLQAFALFLQYTLDGQGFENSFVLRSNARCKMLGRDFAAILQHLIVWRNIAYGR